MSETTTPETTTGTVTIETLSHGYEVYVIDGAQYVLREDDNAADFLKTSWHYALLAKFLDSPERKEQLRLKARRAEIARRYGLSSYRAYANDGTIQKMIDDILKLEEAAK